MSDYRRLISYIYEYEGKEKGKNVGFVKLEARNGQCRLNLSVKKVYVGGNAIGVYLLGKNRQETFLGNIFIRGGNGEFRTTVDAQNVEESGNPLDTYYGLTIHDVKNSWRSYTTIWEDAILPPMENIRQEQEIQNAGQTASAAGKDVARPSEKTESPNHTGGNDTAVRMAREILPEGKKQPQPVSSVVKEIEEEIAREEKRKDMEARTLTYAAEVGTQENLGEKAEEGAAPELIPGLFGAAETTGKPGEPETISADRELSGDDRGADDTMMAGSAMTSGMHATGYVGTEETVDAGTFSLSGMYATGYPETGVIPPSGAYVTGCPRVQIPTAGNPPLPGMYATGYVGAEMPAGVGNPPPSGIYATGCPGIGMPGAAGGVSRSGVQDAAGSIPRSGVPGMAGSTSRSVTGGSIPLSGVPGTAGNTPGSGIAGSIPLSGVPGTAGNVPRSGVYAPAYASAGMAVPERPLPPEVRAGGRGDRAAAESSGPSEVAVTGNTGMDAAAPTVLMPPSSGIPSTDSMGSEASAEAGTLPLPGVPVGEEQSTDAAVTDGTLPSLAPAAERMERAASAAADTPISVPPETSAGGNAGTVSTAAIGTLPLSEEHTSAPGGSPRALQPVTEGTRRNQPGPFMRPGMLGAGPGWFGPLRIPGMNGGRPGNPRMPGGNTARTDNTAEAGERDESPETEHGNTGQMRPENSGNQEPPDEMQMRQSGSEPSNLNVIEFADYGSGRAMGTSRSETPAASPELENPEVLKYLQDTEENTADPELMWQELRRSYPKIQPFDYEDGCEVLTIHPQDIGRLPRESWVYGNNSFLLHGYYSFRYLILVRLGNRKGNPRYLIGVPGHYFSSEKYMASMFGFPNFVLSKKQPPNDNRFGYWYTDIRLR